MGFNLYSDVPVEVSASASIVDDGDTSAKVRVTASSWMTWDNGSVQSSGVYAVITINGTTSGHKRIFGDCYPDTESSFASNPKSTTYDVSVDKTHSSQSISWSVKFHSYVDNTDLGAKETKSGTISVGKKSSYTVSYNANGGSGAPSSQTKWHDESLTISSTKPTRTGYTFQGWSLTQGGSVYYTSGSTCGKNENLTLYAVWQENKLTINYYSNYATSSVKDVENAVGADKNVIVLVGEVYYDNDYSNYGLANYSNDTGSVYMTRIGYTGTGNWGTSTNGGTLVNENTGFASGQAIAEKFGKSLKTGNASVNLYAQWEENTLTVNYYSNYATSAFDGAANEVGADKNVVVNTYEFGYEPDEYYSSYGLGNYSHSTGGLYMERIRYNATGYWCTTTAEDIKLEGNRDDVVSYDGGVAIGENMLFNSGQELAEHLGLTIEDGSKEISLYAHWVLAASQATLYLPDENGNVVRHTGTCYIYDDNGDLHCAILTCYDENGNAHVVV